MRPLAQPILVFPVSDTTGLRLTVELYRWRCSGPSLWFSRVLVGAEAGRLGLRRDLRSGINLILGARLGRWGPSDGRTIFQRVFC